MADQKTTPDDPVNRRRRYSFVSGTVWGCLGTAVTLTVMNGMGFIAQNVTLLELTVGGLISLATALALAYVGGSVIDYNGGVKPLLMGRKNAADAARNEEAKG